MLKIVAMDIAPIFYGKTDRTLKSGLYILPYMVVVPKKKVVE